MTTPAKNLEQPARGSNVGTWDTPVNNNTGIIDAALGQSATVSVSAGSVVLAANQFQCSQIVLSSTLLASISITFPTSFTGFYTIDNTATGSSAFIITLQTTAAGGRVICALPGETFEIFNDGTNIKYKSLGHRIGTYWDYAGSSVPSWVSGCTVPPYLNCDGTTFSSATYPALRAILGSSVLPDHRGRFRLTLDQGVGRVSSAVSGLAANTIFSGGGDQITGQHTHPSSVTDPGHFHMNPLNTNSLTGPGAVAPTFGGYTSTAWATNTVVTGVTVAILNSTNATGAAQNIPPALVAGITMIRSA